VGQRSVGGRQLSVGTGGAVGLGSTGTRAERRGAVDFSAWLGARVREACSRWLSGPWAVSYGTRLGAVQVGRSIIEGSPVYPFSFIHFFQINSKARVSKIQITFLLNSKIFQIWQVDG
jgi:hypothetical protein